MIPLLTYGQNFLGESKLKTKKHFNNWKNNELNWEFNDSIISALCCVEYDNIEGVFHDTISAWSANYEDCFEFKYFFNLSTHQDCDSIFIKTTCNSSGMEIANGILDYTIYSFAKWRIVNDTTFIQPYSIGMDVGKYRTPKMSFKKENGAIVAITIWLAYLGEEEFKSIKSLRKIKTLPNNK